MTSNSFRRKLQNTITSLQKAMLMEEFLPAPQLRTLIFQTSFMYSEYGWKPFDVNTMLQYRLPANTREIENSSIPYFRTNLARISFKFKIKYVYSRVRMYSFADSYAYIYKQAFIERRGYSRSVHQEKNEEDRGEGRGRRYIDTKRFTVWEYSVELECTAMGYK